MAISVAEAFVTLRPKTDGFDHEARPGILGPIKGIAAAAAGIFATVGVAQFLKGAVGGASDLNETVSKARTIFGPAADELERWASGAATAFGQSKQQALDAAGTFGNLFVQLGVGSEQAASMSTAMVELASDFASFHNADPTEVINAQTAAFRGEYDALQRFVPTINAAAVEQEALAVTGKKTTKELTAQEKALAVQALMMKGAGDAAGDFARTSDGLANQQRIMSARFEDARAKLGTALMPAFSAIAGVIVDKVIPAFENVVGGVSRIIDVFKEDGLAGVIDLVTTKFGELWPGVVERLGEFADALFAWLSEMVPKVAEQLVEWGKAFIEWVGPQIPPLLVEAGKLLGKLLEWVLTTGVPKLVASLLKMAAALVEWIAPAIPPMIVEAANLLVKLLDWIVTDALPKLVAELAKWAAEFVAWVAVATTDLLAKLPDLLTELVGWIGQKAADIGTKLLEWSGKFVGWVADAITNLPGKLAELATTLLSWIGEMPRKIAEKAVGMFDGITSAFRSAINAIIRGWNRLEFKIPGFDPPGPGPKFGGFTLGVPNIPLLHSGGLVSASMPRFLGDGPNERTARLEVGETVIPAGTTVSPEESGRRFGAAAAHEYARVLKLAMRTA